MVAIADDCEYLSRVGTTSSRDVIGAVSSRLEAFRSLELSVRRSLFSVGTPCCTPSGVQVRELGTGSH